MITFAFMPAYDGDEREAILLAHNLSRVLREWEKFHSPILILYPDHKPLPEKFTTALKEIPAHLILFHIPEPFRGFPFAPKVFAAAHAEQYTESDLMAWLDSDTLILEPPTAFILPPEKMMAGCPAHLKNISSLASEPIDDFWRNIYSKTPAEKIFTLTTRVDRVDVCAHFNAGCLVVRPKAGLLSAWKKRFEQTAMADGFQPYYEKAPIYAIFIHQAILSAVLMECLSENEILILPENYNYPVFLQGRFGLTPPAQLVTLRYDQFTFFEEQNWKQRLSNRPDWIESLLDRVH
jgi:hypothetical protein